MKVSIDHHGSHATLRLAGHFDMEAHMPFHRACRSVLGEEKVRALSLDLSEVDYIDSSALGMLLLLQEKAEKNNIEITLNGCQRLVLRALTIANFHRLFKIV